MKSDHSYLIPVLFLCLVTTAWADSYKCTDSQKQIIYSDRALAGQTCVKVGGGASTTQAQEAENARKALADKLSQSQQKRQQEADALAKQEKELERQRQKEAACRQARERLMVLQQGGRVARFNERGERYYLDSGQIQSEVAATQQRIAEICN